MIALIVMPQCIDMKILDNVYAKINISIKKEVNFALTVIILGLEILYLFTKKLIMYKWIYIK